MFSSTTVPTERKIKRRHSAFIPAEIRSLRNWIQMLRQWKSYRMHRTVRLSPLLTTIVLRSQRIPSVLLIDHRDAPRKRTSIQSMASLTTAPRKMLQSIPKTAQIALRTGCYISLAGIFLLWAPHTCLKIALNMAIS